jgi:hypothetical protein
MAISPVNQTPPTQQSGGSGNTRGSLRSCPTTSGDEFSRTLSLNRVIGKFRIIVELFQHHGKVMVAKKHHADESSGKWGCSDRSGKLHHPDFAELGPTVESVENPRDDGE